MTPEPMISRRHLGRALAAARAEAGFTQQRAAAGIDVSLSKIIRIETGESGCGKSDLDALLNLYQVGDPDTRTRLAALARSGRGRTWYAQYRTVLSLNASFCLSDETAAASIAEHRTFTLPPLLQPLDAAREHLEAAGLPHVEERLQLLAERRRRLATSPAAISFTIDEDVLRRVARDLDDDKALVPCLDVLRDMAARIHAEVRVVPRRSGRYPPRPDTFTLIDNVHGDSIAYFLPVPGYIPDCSSSDPRIVAECRSRFEQLRRISPDISSPGFLDALRTAPRQVWPSRPSVFPDPAI